jgi:glycerol kinase
MHFGLAASTMRRPDTARSAKVVRTMSRYIAAIDQGTTSTRFIVFDARGATVTSAQKEHRQICPQPGWVEHCAVEIASNMRQVIGVALERASLTVHDLAAVGITNQRETTLIWDRRSGEPLHHALVWQDTRVDPLVARYSAQGGKDRVRARTGLPLASYFSALKLKWLLDNVPGARERARSGDLLFGTMDTWVLWNLTGGIHGGLHVTDVTNASRTQLMRLDTLAWDEELLRLFDIPRAVLPRIASSGEHYGKVAQGPLHGLPVAGILGDQQAALVGQTCFAPGEAKNTYGTGCFLLMNTGLQPVGSRAGLITTVAYRFADAPAHYALEGSIAISGALVQWLRDNLGLIDSSAEVESLAASVADNGDVYIVPAFSGLYAPYWQEDARGIIAGLTRYAHRGHIARAALEATAYQTRDVLSAMEQDSGIELGELRVDGGMVRNELLMQFQADILGVRVVRPEVTETTALGAAYAAGLTTGYWKDIDELKRNWGVARAWMPAMAEQQRERLYSSWKKAVTRSFGWIEQE